MEKIKDKSIVPTFNEFVEKLNGTVNEFKSEKTEIVSDVKTGDDIFDSKIANFRYMIPEVDHSKLPFHIFVCENVFNINTPFFIVTDEVDNPEKRKYLFIIKLPKKTEWLKNDELKLLFILGSTMIWNSFEKEKLILKKWLSAVDTSDDFNGLNISNLNILFNFVNGEKW
jgi:hypothetical protein